MNALLKAACLAVYALALAGLAGLLPTGLAGTMQNIALALLVIHALEIVVMFKHVRLYRGPLAVSMLLHPAVWPAALETAGRCNRSGPAAAEVAPGGSTTR